MAASITFVWHGLSCFSIEARNGDSCANLVTDPFDASVGLKLPRSLSGDMVTVSNDRPEYNNVEAVKTAGDKKLFTINAPGEYEVGGLFVYGITAPFDEKKDKERGALSLYRYEVGDLSVVNLGGLGCGLNDEQFEVLEDVDVLLVPVGGGSSLSAKQAIEIITRLEPRIVIPMHYAVSGLKGPTDGVEKFLKEMGVASPERVTKFKAVKKDLPVEETKVVVLDID